MQILVLAAGYATRLYPLTLNQPKPLLPVAGKPMLEHIIERVGSFFQIAPGDIQSSRRLRRLALPRQISIYLARQLTDLSLEQIGGYFGGRDHSTVLYACRKLQQMLGRPL